MLQPTSIAVAYPYRIAHPSIRCRCIYRTVGTITTFIPSDNFNEQRNAIVLGSIISFKHAGTPVSEVKIFCDPHRQTVRFLAARGDRRDARLLISSARSLPLRICCRVPQQLLALPSRRNSRTTRQKAAAVSTRTAAVQVQLQVRIVSLNSYGCIAGGNLRAFLFHLTTCRFSFFFFFSSLLLLLLLRRDEFPRVRVRRSVGI